MSDRTHEINLVIRQVSLFFSLCLFAASIAAAVYTGETPGQVLKEFYTLLSSPSPLVTDYFRLGSLSAAFFNAALCGMACTLLIAFLRNAKLRPNVWAGFFLVIAHCFYGLNFLNMWPPMLGFLFYCKLHKLRFRDNLDWAMFITSFAPFISELLFRYPFAMHLDIVVLGRTINLVAIFFCVLLSLFFGCALPAIMPGAGKLHRGFNLYNGGLATGLMGLFVYAFMYKTFGVTPPLNIPAENAFYTAHNESYMVFCTVFYAFVFGSCLLFGRHLNGGTLKGYQQLLADSGYKTNFLKQYDKGLTLINLGFYGLMMTAYFDIVILLTDGAGFNGATCGIVLAAMTFAASGQHPRNVWPILLGYALLSLLVHGVCLLDGRDIPWTLSTQGYMNGIAFATGLCPFTGKFGWKTGILAGFMSAVMCTTVSVMHGGFVLYNGGLNAGITALLLLPLLDTYKTHLEKWGRGNFMIKEVHQEQSAAEQQTSADEK